MPPLRLVNPPPASVNVLPAAMTIAPLLVNHADVPDWFTVRTPPLTSIVPKLVKPLDTVSVELPALLACTRRIELAAVPNGILMALVPWATIVPWLISVPEPSRDALI